MNALDEALGDARDAYKEWALIAQNGFFVSLVRGQTTQEYLRDALARDAEGDVFDFGMTVMADAARVGVELLTWSKMDEAEALSFVRRMTGGRATADDLALIETFRSR